MDQTTRDKAEKLFQTPFDSLNEHQRHVAHHIAKRTPISKNVLKELPDKLTLGQRTADAVASFGGSWPFIGIFGGVMVVWIVLNSFILAALGGTFDPYPYILLNLVLSMLAAIQAPIIMMSQNRQAYKDRVSAEHDYEVNLKAELEIMGLHEKVDGLKEKQWLDLIALQQEQIGLLQKVLDGQKGASH